MGRDPPSPANGKAPAEEPSTDQPSTDQPSTDQPAAQQGAAMDEEQLKPAPTAGGAAEPEGAQPSAEAKAGARAFMVANAGLPNWSVPQFMAILLLTVITQLSWGLYGVCTRYLQVQTPKPIPTLQLMVCLNLLAWPGMIIFASLPNWYLARRKERKERKERLAAEAAAAADDSKGAPDAQSADSKDSTPAEAADEEAPAEAADAPPQPTRKERFRKWLKSQLIANGIGSIAVFQAMTQVYAAKEANAYVSQMIFMTSPLFAAITNRVVLKQPTPYGLWPTVFLTITGAVLVVVGQLQQNSEESGDAGVPSTGGLILGCCLALLSTLLLTAYLVFIQVTRHLVTGEAVLWAKRNVGLLIFIPLSLIVYGTDWSWVTALNGKGWAVLMFTGIYIYTLANIWLQFCSRALGAALISAFLSLRLVSSVVGSIIMLKETPNKAITWVGLGVVGVVTAAFVVVQHQHRRRAAKRAAEAAAAEEAQRAALEEGGEPDAAGAAPPGRWGSFMSHGASFLRGPNSFLGESVASFRRRQLRGASAPARASFMNSLGLMSDTGFSPALLLERDLTDDEDDVGSSPASRPASKRSVGT